MSPFPRHCEAVQFDRTETHLDGRGCRLTVAGTRLLIMICQPRAMHGLICTWRTRSREQDLAELATLREAFGSVSADA